MTVMGETCMVSVRLNRTESTVERVYNPQKYASDFRTEETVYVIPQNNFLRDYLGRFS